MEIGIWGDSITYGNSDSEALGWVGRLRKTFPVGGDYIEVHNRGIGGDTTEDLLKRFEVEAGAIEADVIVFAIGINDSKYPNGRAENKVSLETFKENVKKIIALARTHTDVIFVVGLTRVDERKLDLDLREFDNLQIEIYNRTLKELSNENQLTFIDVLDVLDVQTELYDGLHPNAQGYDKMATVISEKLRINNAS